MVKEIVEIKISGEAVRLHLFLEKASYHLPDFPCWSALSLSLIWYTGKQREDHPFYVRTGGCYGDESPP